MSDIEMTRPLLFALHRFVNFKWQIGNYPENLVKQEHLPVEEVLSDEDLLWVGLQFVLSDDRWEDLSEVD